MKSVLPVKMLAALALVLLVSSATEGRLLSKCELKAQLEAAQIQQITVMGEKITVNDLIARLVCKANSSAFNTSFVKAITVNNKENKPAQAPSQAPAQALAQALAQAIAQAPAQAKSGSPRKPDAQGPPKPDAQGPRKPDAQGPPKPDAQGPPKPDAQGPRKPDAQGPPKPDAQGPRKPDAQGPPKPDAQGPPKPDAQGPRKPDAQGPRKPHTQGPPKPHTQGPTKGPEGSVHETQHPHLNATAKVFGQVYGVFQLGDQLACDSGMIPSLNVCNMSCSALTDDDISDDITCLKTLMNSMKSKPKEKLTDVKKILETLMVKECRSVVPKTYFADCA
ncbi:hypothetical protein R3I93_005725 [Phoxinus phoxinus]|uniref:lysozyme n=1 Tax=Phoxinus phoxinus TaxID=58324 RepID=A0AAN9DA45_9TELE